MLELGGMPLDWKEMWRVLHRFPRAHHAVEENVNREEEEQRETEVEGEREEADVEKGLALANNVTGENHPPSLRLRAKLDYEQRRAAKNMPRTLAVKDISVGSLRFVVLDALEGGYAVGLGRISEVTSSGVVVSWLARTVEGKHPGQQGFEWPKPGQRAFRWPSQPTLCSPQRHQNTPTSQQHT